ncbi:MAG: hypothetical protein KBT47_00795, partial [Armatimonadetes bacterium]|nr:hypothetical protein [Candidatus Hippobium faecium]
MNRIKLCGNPLNLELTLNSGQAFRWRKNNNLWQGFINNKLCEITKEEDFLYFSENISQDEIIRYFLLDNDLNKIYSELIASDRDLEPIIDKYYGLRIMRQETEETLYSFLCSACNAIPKIMAGCEKFCALFSENIKENGRYSFPTTSQIIKNDRQKMGEIKEIAFRGKNIFDTALIISQIPSFFDNLQNSDYEIAKETLTGIKNIGPKIADCICLFSLDFPFAVPVDTHVRQIAQKKWGYEMKGKTISKTNYRDIQKLFENKYGNNAGLAQQFLS